MHPCCDERLLQLRRQRLPQLRHHRQLFRPSSSQPRGRWLSFRQRARTHISSLYRHPFIVKFTFSCLSFSADSFAALTFFSFSFFAAAAALSCSLRSFSSFFSSGSSFLPKAPKTPLRRRESDRSLLLDVGISFVAAAAAGVALFSFSLSCRAAAPAPPTAAPPTAAAPPLAVAY